ncbi:MAG: phosphoglycerate kinase [Pseudomonadota bacterium]
MTFNAITAIAVTGRRLVIRADLNVPMHGGVVSDTTRIERFAEGLIPLLDKGASAVILSHFGRPDGVRVEALSLAPVADALEKALGRSVAFCPETHGEAAEQRAGALEPGEVLVCENLRFDAREEANDPEFADALARLGDIYVNDAFSCAHRAHASTVAIAERLPAYAGPLMIAELDALTQALEAPRRPAIAIVGGSKVSTKIDVLQHLVKNLDAVIIGGGMANTFLAFHGIPVGKSICEPGQFETVKAITEAAMDSGCNIVLPIDIVWAEKLEPNVEAHIDVVGGCPPQGMILDAGPGSVERIWGLLGGAGTLLWNGPVGAFEVPPFEHATEAIALEAARLTRAGKLVSVAGGGDTVAALNAAQITEAFTYVSTAGGAFLEWLEGKELPGVAALRQRELA